jgi:nucleotide-binding universal stress UspA family protein
MNPKDIVVFVEEEEGRYNRLKYAVSIAEMWKAHLIVTFVPSRIELSPHRSFARGEGLRSMIQSHNAAVVEEEAKTRTFFEKLVKKREITSEWRSSHNEAGETLMLHARHASLAIVGPSARITGPVTTLSLSEDIIFASGRPTLMLPIDWPADRIPKRIVIGWNGRREATRAIAAAMPFLAAAESVHLVVVPESKVRNLFGEDPGIDMSRHLARHGVPVVLEQCEGEKAREALLERAAYYEADMLVMGAYSTPKISEYIFGSVTQTVLDQADIPVFLAR